MTVFVLVICMVFTLGFASTAYADKTIAASMTFAADKIFAADKTLTANKTFTGDKTFTAEKYTTSSDSSSLRSLMAVQENNDIFICATGKNLTDTYSLYIDKDNNEKTGTHIWHNI